MLGLRAALSLCALALLTGCRGQSSTAEPDAGRADDAAPLPQAKGGGSPRPDPPSFTRSPLSQAELPTTDGSIAMSNLGAQVDGLTAQLKRSPKDAVVKEGVIQLLATRGQFAGRIADYELALSLAEELVKEEPKRPESYLARAGARATFHRFKDALDDLAEVDRLKPGWARARSLRAAILEGMGRLDEALALRREASKERPSVQSVGSEAALLGQMGKLDEAARLFAEAPRYFHDVSAFPIAWLYFEEGSMWERAQKPARARELFEAAVSRLPAYAPAAAHLAAMEPYARGIELLQPAVARSDDPEVTTALSDLLRKKGDAAGADARLAEAKARYEALIAAHPEAFADHAARFWLNAGGDQKKALALAKKNLEVRKTEAAYDLVIVTALAAGSQADACAAAKEGEKLAYASDLFRQTAAEVARKCP